MTSKFFGLDSESSGSTANCEELDEANKQILKIAGPLKITGMKRAHEFRVRDFVIIAEKPCQVESTRFVSPTGKLLIAGRPTVPIPDEPGHGKRRNNPYFAIEVSPMDEIQIPEVKFLFVSQLRKGEYLPINDHPCKIIDFSFSKCACHNGGGVHVIGVDIFTGKNMEALVSHQFLISRLEVKWEQKQLLDISDDFFCALMGENNTAEENVEVPDQILGKAIKDIWGDGERNIMVVTAEAMGINGVVSACEVAEMKLIGISGAGKIEFEDMEMGTTINVSHPLGERGEEMDRLLEDVKRGRAVVMEVHVPFPKLPFYPSEASVHEILIGKEVRNTCSDEDELSSSWNLMDM